MQFLASVILHDVDHSTDLAVMWARGHSKKTSPTCQELRLQVIGSN